MPIYEYECIKCKKKSERLQGFDEPEKKTIKCKSCGAQAKKIPSIPGRRYRYMDSGRKSK